MRRGEQTMLCGLYVVHHERCGAAIFFTPDGVKRGARIAIMLEHERWDRVFSASCTGVLGEARTAEVGETCCVFGGSRTRCSVGDCHAPLCRELIAIGKVLVRVVWLGFSGQNFLCLAADYDLTLHLQVFLYLSAFTWARGRHRQIRE